MRQVQAGRARGQEGGGEVPRTGQRGEALGPLPGGIAVGFVMTPAVVVNGRVISQGRVPRESELERVFRSELGG